VDTSTCHIGFRCVVRHVTAVSESGIHAHGQCLRGVGNRVPCHPWQVMPQTWLADNLAVCVNQQINRVQPCST
jgi:hypothetical protein